MTHNHLFVNQFTFRHPNQTKDKFNSHLSSASEIKNEKKNFLLPFSLFYLQNERKTFISKNFLMFII